jgi:hypothetical protein
MLQTTEAPAGAPTEADADTRSDERKKRDRFDAIFAEWLRNRARYMSEEVTCNEEEELSESELQLAREITTTPAVYGWMILRKLEVSNTTWPTRAGLAGRIIARS